MDDLIPVERKDETPLRNLTQRVMIRRRAAAKAATTAASPAGEGIFDDLSKQELLEFWAAYGVLATALVEASLEPRDQDTARAFIERIAACLRAATPHSGDPDSLAGAEGLLR